MKLVLIFLIISVFLTISLSAQENELDWPREIETDKTVITMYQPQPESFKEDTLEGRMAISIKPADEDMIFCAVWIKAVVSTDRDSRTFTLESVSIPRVNFPDMDDADKIE